MPVSYSRSEIEYFAEQQARKVFDELLKSNKEKKLKIENIVKLTGMKYDDRLTITGVLEDDKYYEFHLNNDRMNSAYKILLHRRETDTGYYIMQYESKTMWVKKSDIDTPEKIIKCMNTI